MSCKIKYKFTFNFAGVSDRCLCWKQFEVLLLVARAFMLFTGTVYSGLHISAKADGLAAQEWILSFLHNVDHRKIVVIT